MKQLRLASDDRFFPPKYASKPHTGHDFEFLSCKFSQLSRPAPFCVVSGKAYIVKKEMTVNVPLLSEISDKVLDQCIDKSNEVLLEVFQENRK